ncbi:hypothetical protein SAMN05428949_6355 [Chitinophaga sp. YR627]|uniref:hypothetical protein n=1 Tax=Chitinophaga sp. YR627 TaxID=1881041 RepID=UPI0008EA679C|nr:hypothetical protein [Chitinophaga sp. YR627]SFO72665.1 hypothetical protein SAMN05428949_6355 [Chitinophaga sp. YR627]
MEKKQLFRNSSFIIVFLCAAFTAGAQVRLSDFRYIDNIEGYWTMKTKLGIYAEKWKRVDEHTWKGRTMRLIKGDSTKVDDMRLFLEGDGIYFTIAAVRDSIGEPVRFKLRVLKSVGFVAENLQSPYPQKIIYRWKDTKHMDAHFEGKDGRVSREFIMQYIRQ